LIHIDTRNILFVCGGAFEGLEKTIARRLRKNVIGFMSDSDDAIEVTSKLLKEVEPEDLLQYGFIPELAGRLPVLAPLEELSDEALRSILLDPKNAITKQYRKLFIIEGVELEFDSDALEAIVQKAKVRKTGARALRAIVEEVMLRIMYELPDRKDVVKCIITEAVVNEGAEPEYVMSTEKSRKKIA
jgi:ATP-dependent Clp protease ATP-binding subunit ClpX